MPILRFPLTTTICFCTPDKTSIDSIKYIFYDYDTTSVGDTNIRLVEGQFNKFIAEKNGWLFISNVRANKDLTAGSILVRPTKNGSVFGSNSLNVTLDDTDSQKQATVTPEDANFSFLVGDEIGMIANGNALSSPNLLNISVKLTFIYQIT